MHILFKNDQKSGMKRLFETLKYRPCKLVVPFLSD